MNKILGFTLIELMLTLFLCSFIFMSLTTIFILSKKNDAAVLAFMQLQDNIDVASNVLTSAIQAANSIEPYSEGFMVNKTKCFFVGKTDRVHRDGSSIYALYIKDQQGKHELIEDLLGMQMRYSYLDHGVLKESKADGISDWSKVIGASVAILFSSMGLKKEMYIYAALRA